MIWENFYNQFEKTENDKEYSTKFTENTKNMPTITTEEVVSK